MGRKKIMMGILFIILLFVVFDIFIAPRYILFWLSNCGIEVNNKQIFIDNLTTLCLISIISLLVVFIYLLFNTLIKRIINLLILKLLNIEFKYLLYPLIVLTVIYIVILFFTSITQYDLGHDEAWYLNYANNFNKYWYPFFTFNEKVSFIDVYSILPYYVTYKLYFLFFDKTIINVKILSVCLSVFGIIIFYISLYKNSNHKAALIALFLMMLLPGFGFVSTSFFGEILAVGLVSVAASQLYLHKRLYIAAILFAIAIHTKFQLLPIIIVSQIIIYFISKDKIFLRNIMYVFIFTFVIIIVRSIIPVLNDNDNFIKLIKQFYNLTLTYHSSSSFGIPSRIELFNRLYSVQLFVFVALFSYSKLKNNFDKFIYSFALITVIYWIFFFRYVTYRHLFMGLMPLCYLTSLILTDFFSNESLRQYQIQPINRLLQRGILVLSVFFVFFYGSSSNLTHAKIGYNDGVQFDMDGYQSRLFTPIKRDNSQIKFYMKVMEILNDKDIILSPSPHLTKFFLPNNQVFSLDFIKNESMTKDSNLYIIISRESYPGCLSKGYNELKEYKITYDTILEYPDFHLLHIVKL